MDKISGGYYIKARKIMESQIMKSPPVVREVWDWIIMNAWFKDAENGRLKRGQILTTVNDIIDGLSWFVGYSKRGYTVKQTRGALKVLEKGGMIVTTKVTNGTLITVCNYSFYQDFNNYVGYNEGHAKGARRESTGQNYNENEWEKEDKEKNKDKGKKIEKPDDVSNQVWNDFLIHRKTKKAAISETVISRFRQEAAKVGWTLEQAIIESCAQNWQGFKAEWVRNTQNKGIGGQNNATGKLTKHQRKEAALDRAQQLLDAQNEARPDSLLSLAEL